MFICDPEIEEDEEEVSNETEVDERDGDSCDFPEFELPAGEYNKEDNLH